MNRRHPAVAILALVACTSSTTPATEQRAAADPIEATPAQPSRCNAKVADAAAAIALAEDAKRQAGFADVHEVDGPKARVSEGFLLSPMIPPQWPPVDCKVLFYVSKDEVVVGDSVHTHRDWVAVRIAVQLDTGAVALEVLEDVPVLGGWLPSGGGGTLEPARQQWVFEAVANSSTAEVASDVEAYRTWLRSEEYVAVALYAWHREFFDAVVAGDEDIMRDVQAHFADWRANE